jgi:NAD(P)-dependent dehydrogenase (short-subunit alcohol dehydrogenase family)
MARIATTTLISITSIGEVVVVILGAKGLGLHECLRARSFGSKCIAVAVKKETTQLKTTHRKVLTALKQKIGESMPWISVDIANVID